MKRFQYPVLPAPAEEGGLVVTCRDLPPPITEGEDEDEDEDEDDATAQAIDTMDEVFATYMIEGIDFQSPPRRAAATTICESSQGPRGPG